jgi:hypothetical protein
MRDEGQQGRLRFTFPKPHNGCYAALRRCGCWQD